MSDGDSRTDQMLRAIVEDALNEYNCTPLYVIEQLEIAIRAVIKEDFNMVSKEFRNSWTGAMDKLYMDAVSGRLS